MLVTAVGWEIFERTGSTLALGYVGLVQMIPMFLFVFPAGHVADNYSRKHVIFWALLGVTASCAGMLAVSAWHGSVIWTYACLFFLGTARTYLWPASVSFLPQIVSRAQFPRAVTWNTGTFQIAAVAGPALGGALIALTGGAAVVYAFNVVAGLVCMVMISLVTAHGRVAVRERRKCPSRGVVVGLRFIFHSKIVLGSITLDMFAVLLGGATAMLPVYAKTILHVGPNGLRLAPGRAAAGLAVHVADNAAPAAAAKSRAHPALGGGAVRAGHGGLWPVALVLAVRSSCFLRAAQPTTSA